MPRVESFIETGVARIGYEGLLDSDLDLTRGEVALIHSYLASKGAESFSLAQ
jgi:hypothetical protein